MAAVLHSRASTRKWSSTLNVNTVCGFLKLAGKSLARMRFRANWSDDLHNAMTPTHWSIKYSIGWYNDKFWFRSEMCSWVLCICFRRVIGGLLPQCGYIDVRWIVLAIDMRKGGTLVRMMWDMYCQLPLEKIGLLKKGSIPYLHAMERMIRMTGDATWLAPNHRTKTISTTICAWGLMASHACDRRCNWFVSEKLNKDGMSLTDVIFKEIVLGLPIYGWLEYSNW